MGPTHYLVTNVRFRKTKSTVSVKSDFGPIGSISRSIADTQYIIVVKLIKSVIANPTEGQDGLRPTGSHPASALPFHNKK